MRAVGGAVRGGACEGVCCVKQYVEQYGVQCVPCSNKVGEDLQK